MYYSTAGGDTKWFLRTAGANVQDIAVESQDVLYIAKDAAATVYKSTNAGFTWGPAKTTKLAGNIWMLKSLGEDLLIAGGDDGWVSYSTDGASSWTKISKQVDATAATNNISVTASGLEDGDFIYAGTATAGSNIYRWTIGTSTKWSDILNGTLATAAGDSPASTNMGCYGLALEGGVLYALASSTTDSGVWRTLGPSTAGPTTTWSYKLTTDADNVAFWDAVNSANLPQALKVSAGSTKLWAMDVDNDKLYVYTDTLAEAGPTLAGPADGAVIAVNPVSGNAYDVSFTWERPSLATKYDLYIAFDEAFTESATSKTGYDPAGDPSTVSYVVGPGGTTVYSYMPGTTYYWRVRCSSDGPVYSPFSEVRSFTIEELAVKLPEILAPKNGSTDAALTPAFSWSPVTGAAKYEFQLAAGPFAKSFANPIAAATVAETGIRPVVKLDYDRTYFWRVRAVGGEWSPVANFTTMAAPVEPTPPVVVQQVPPPVIQIPPAPPAQQIVIPPAPAPPAPITPAYIWAIVIIGAILVIAVIVLIVRTRRPV